MLVFDTETRTDTAQALTFGSYRYYEHGICLEEGLFYGDDLPRADRATLEAYVKTHAAATDRRRGVPQLRLLIAPRVSRKALYCGFRWTRPDRGLQSAFRSVTARLSISATRRTSALPAAFRWRCGTMMTRRPAPDQQVPAAHRDQAYRQ